MSSQEGYARLPEDLLRDLLAGAETVTQQVSELLGPALEARAELRQTLQDLGLIQTFSQVPPSTISGVDGGFAVERTAAVDISLAVAVGVEGLSNNPTFWDGTQYEWWTRVDKHDLEAERLVRGVMVAQELSIISAAPHLFRILDGSHVTPVIQLNSALTCESADLRAEARRVWQRLDTARALESVCRSQAIVAMPKYDSSREIAKQLEQRSGRSIPGDDKYLMALLLEAGELTPPQRVSAEPWGTLHFDGTRSPEDREIADAFTHGIRPLVERDIEFTYFKPDALSPAFRLELKRDTDSSSLNTLCSTLSAQITGPFVREPYPQYLADVMAKSVGLGLSALQTAVQLGLSGMGKPEISEMLIRSYRTEGI